MRTLRAVIKDHYQLSAWLMVILVLWMSSAQPWSSVVPTDASSDRVAVPEADVPADEEPPVVVSSLEAVVTPVAKLQLTFFFSLIQELAFTEEVVERGIFSVPLPRSEYLRTLFPLIISPNAP